MDTQNLIKELQFKAVRSSGAGGQHVNKVSSKIELSFDIANSNELSEEQKELLYKTLSSRLKKEKKLILFADESRSQHRNKEIAIKKIFALLKKGLTKPKIRKATKPSKASIKRKAETKRKHALKKHLRKKSKWD